MSILESFLHLDDGYCQQSEQLLGLGLARQAKAAAQSPNVDLEELGKLLSVGLGERGHESVAALLKNVTDLGLLNPCLDDGFGMAGGRRFVERSWQAVLRRRHTQDLKIISILKYPCMASKTTKYQQYLHLIVTWWL